MDLKSVDLKSVDLKSVDLPSVGLKERAVVELDAVRRRSLDLLAPLDDGSLIAQHSPLMSPLVWDLAHVGNYEDLWLVRAVGRQAAVDPALDEIYDAFRHGRAERPSLPLLGPAAARRYIATVRGRALDILETVEFDPDVALLADGFVVGLVVQHEHQHAETMLATLQLMAGDGYRPIAPPPPRPADIGPQHPVEVRIPAGPFVMGTNNEAWAYDNERPAHVIDLPEFWIDTFPVTNEQWREFVDDGGYQRPNCWAPQGWAWRQASGADSPEFWRWEGPGSWSRNRFGWIEELPLHEPVQHVSWFEADAFARWAGKRLPTEAEWEKAARWSPAALVGQAGPAGQAGATGAAGSSGSATLGRYPWGDEAPTAAQANLGGRYFRPAAVGALPGGRAPSGAQQMIGDVWEWTSSDFKPYPGFASFPYVEYSEVFFGSAYKVLRGGSWATHPSAIRSTFRNWDYPIRRQIFAGVRCARDACPSSKE